MTDSTSETSVVVIEFPPPQPDSIVPQPNIDQHPLVVPPDMMLKDVVNLMNQGSVDYRLSSQRYQIASLVASPANYVLVMLGQELQGIFTERDVVKLSAQSMDFATVKVADVMTRQLVTLRASDLWDALTVLKLFCQYHIRHLPITNDCSEVVGVVTAESLRQSLQPTNLLKMRSVSEVMSTHTITTSPSCSIVEVAQLMTTHQISCVVIVESEDQASASTLHPIGIITERDILQFQTQDLHLHSLQASSVMSQPLVCLLPGDPLSKAFQTMQKLRVRRLVVADAQGGLAGILTQTNMLSVLNTSEIYSTVALLQQQVEQLQADKVQLLQTLNTKLENQVKAGEVAIEAYQKCFQATFEHAAVGIAHVHLQGQFFRVNQRFCDWVGYSQTELLQKTFSDITHPDDQELDQQQVQQLIQGEIDSFSREKRYLHPNGSVSWGNVTVSMVSASSAEPGYLIAVVEDVSDRKRAEQKLQQLNQQLESRAALSTAAFRTSEKRFRLAFEEAAIGMALVAPDGRWLRVNQAICNIVGYPEAELLKIDFQKITHADDLEIDLSYVQQLLAGEINTCQLEKRYYHKQGQIIWVLLSVSLVRDEQGQPLYFIAQIQDITENKRAEQDLFAEKELAQVTLQSIGDAVITTDVQGKITKFNPVAEYLTGWTIDQAQGKPISEVFNIINEETREPAKNPVHRALREGQVVGLANHTILISREGIEFAIEDSAAPIRDRQDQLIGAVMVFHDVTHSRNLTHQLSWQASHDPLTRLANRRKFDQVLQKACDESLSDNAQHVLCFLDLDQFKVINDTCGHAAGDELLCQVAKLLQQPIRATDTLARLGGDEFGILLRQCPLDRAKIIAEQIRNTIQDFRFEWASKIFSIGVSIGLVQLDSHSLDIGSALGAADAACYTAKSRGRNRIQVYEANDEVLIQQRGDQWWNVRIKQAITENRFCLYGQCIVPTSETTENQTQSCEILLRMIGEQDEVISAAEFIPAAEHYNLSLDIDRWVISEFLSDYDSKLQSSENKDCQPT